MLNAEIEYHRIRNAVAFNVQGGKRDHRNQHYVRYSFPDGSRLALHRGSFARVFSPGGLCIIIGSIRVNVIG